jgi:hypothetical protein
LLEPGPHELEHQRPELVRHRGPGPPGDRDEHRLDLRLRQEHRRGHASDDLGRRPRGDLHAHGAVAVVARCCGEPLTDLALDHHQHAGDLGHVVEQVGHERRGHVVRQVRDEHPTVVAGEQRVPVERAGVALDDTGAERLDLLAQDRHEPAVDFDGGDLRAGLDQ